MRPVDRQEALVGWLELEREAAWLYPFLGARQPELADAARASAAAHRASRDRLLAHIERDPTTARATYPVGPVDSVEAARTAARDLERRIQAACIVLVAASTGNARTLGVTGVRTAAVAEVRWGGTARAFPGLEVEQTSA